MSTKKKKATISDAILDLLKPKELCEEKEENTTRIEDFNEIEESAIDRKLSSIRKQNVKQLQDLDEKYKGKTVNRKDLDKFDGDSSEEEENEDIFASDSDQSDQEKEQASGGESMPEDEEGSDDDSESDLEDPENNFDITQFTKPKSSKDTLKDPESESDLEEPSNLMLGTSGSEDIKKGVCVQNQLKLWEKLLEVRIKSQKMLITSNSLPNSVAYSTLTCSEDPSFAEAAENATKNLCELLDNLLELQSSLVSKFPETKDLIKKSRKHKTDEPNGNKSTKKTKLADYSNRIEENYSAFTSYRNNVIQKWHDRTKLINVKAKNVTGDLSVLTKIENSLLNKSELIRKTQVYRGDYQICGIQLPDPIEGEESTPEVAIPEIFDDSDFYHQLLRELIEYKTNTADNPTEITKKFIELQKVRSKMKKKVDTRASKGRKIRYVVHNKIVNFMAPRDNQEWTDESKSELYSSLFGQANQIC